MQLVSLGASRPLFRHSTNHLLEKSEEVNINLKFVSKNLDLKGTR